MDIVAHTLTWNEERYLGDFFASFDVQARKGVVLRMLDNGSTDGSVAHIQRHHSHSFIGRNVKNLGSCAGYNQLFKFTFERWLGQDLSKKGILLLRANTILDPDFVKELELALERDETLGAVQPKVFRAFPPEDGEGIGSPVKSDVLDSTGYILSRSWRPVQRGMGEIDIGKYDGAQDVLGGGGGAVLFRASALIDVAQDGEIFDEDFFSAREDADLALRLRSAGWKTRFVPTAKAWHYYDGGVSGAEAKRAKRNDLLLIAKNAPMIAVLPAFLKYPLYSMTFSFFLAALKKRKAVRNKAKAEFAFLRSYMM